ncbi:hypothetical protein OsI_09162 [Oryza sativa Indica Group]|uniref:Uncharacterized protein n=1 Tax=Oryza sativa subsp. indica TaxID=39946 RepID=A2XA87_ORYSI|nr:hypothetical protein OsI_09162 [Oryza sativa Indica Group]
MVDVKHTAGHAGARRVKLFRVPRRPARAAEEAGAPLVPAGERRKRKMAVARLGGGAGGRRRLFGAFRRLRVRWLAALYRRSLRRLRACYAKAIRDVLEGAALVGAARADAGV